MKGKRPVLVTDGGHGGSRDCLAAVRGLREAGYPTSLAVAGASFLSRHSRYAGRRVTVPSMSDPAFADAVLSEVRRGDYLTVVAASEGALIALGMEVPRLVNKVAMQEAARACGIPTPPSFVFDSVSKASADAREISFPAIVKPTVRDRSAAYVADRGALQKAFPEDLPVVVQPYLREDLHAVSGVVWNGRVVAAVHEAWLRIWPRWCGLPCASVTVEADEGLENRLSRLMAGYDGVFCAQLAGPYLFDLNLRVCSTHPLAVAAGVNLVGLFCDLLDGKAVPEPPVRARPGVFFRWLEGDVRRVVGDLRDGRISARNALQALRPRLGTAHSTESLSDPGPMISRLLYGLSRMRMSQEERMASGSTSLREDR